MTPDLARYRPWFYAAALYNLVWGTFTIVFPTLFFDLIHAPQPNYPALWQVVGMFVLVYAPAYYWAGRNPAHHRHFILVGLLGKICGPVGFVWSVATHQLPLAFGLTILTNDLLWWPAFFLYLRDAAKVSGGWINFLKGD
jgi:hypothetical protein